MHVRSPVRFNGVKVGEEARERYEANWIRRERERQERKAKKESEEGKDRRRTARTPAEIDSIMARTGCRSTSAATRVPTEPRFVSEAYFMDFKFEAGNYYLAGREKLEGQEVLKIEYYPTKMFGDSDERQGATRQEKEKSADRSRTAETPREAQATARGEGVRGGHRAPDEQDGAHHALGRSRRAPDRQVHVRQRLAGFPARAAGW